MVTRSVISSSEQFSAVQHVEMMTILFFLVTTCSGSPHNSHSINTIGQGNWRGGGGAGRAGVRILRPFL